MVVYSKNDLMKKENYILMMKEIGNIIWIVNHYKIKSVQSIRKYL